jgi:hypothetical protein
MLRSKSQSQTKKNALTGQIKITMDDLNLGLNPLKTIKEKREAKKMEAEINNVFVSANMKRGATVASINIDQGDTDFCVGCTIARHFVTFVFDTLKKNNYTNYTTKDIFDLIALYKYRLLHTTNVDTGAIMPIDKTNSISYLPLSIYANELNQNNIKMIDDGISFGYAVHYDITFADNSSFAQTGSVLPSHTYSITYEELNKIGIFYGSTKRIVNFLNLCSTYIANDNKQVNIYFKTKKDLTMNDLITYGQNSIISLGALDNSHHDTMNNWYKLTHTPRGGDVTFRQNNNIGDHNEFHSIYGYNVISEDGKDVLILKNSYKDQGTSIISISGVPITGVLYELDAESLSFIYDLVKLILVPRSDYWKQFKGGKTKAKTRKHRKGRRKTRKQNKLK